jgi:hypothetical protein
MILYHLFKNLLYEKMEQKKGIVFQSYIQEKIIKIIAEYGYITSSEIKLLLSGSEEKAQNILYYMSSKKIISSFKTHMNPAYAYILTTSTKILITQSGLVEFIRPFISSKYKPITFYHHTTMIKIHIILEEILGNSLQRYISSYRLANQQTEKICDAEIHYIKHDNDNKPQNKIAAIEIELTPKSKKILMNNAHDLLSQSKARYNSVIIIYNLIGIKQNWQNTIKQIEIFPPSNFFFIQDIDIIQNKKNCIAYDINDTIIPLF